MSELKSSKPVDLTTSPSEIQTLLTSVDARVQKFGDVLQTLQNDQVLFVPRLFLTIFATYCMKLCT